jgi:hypothetical protein
MRRLVTEIAHKNEARGFGIAGDPVGCRESNHLSDKRAAYLAKDAISKLMVREGTAFFCAAKRSLLRRRPYSGKSAYL